MGSPSQGDFLAVAAVPAAPVTVPALDPAVAAPSFAPAPAAPAPAPDAAVPSLLTVVPEAPAVPAAPTVGYCAAFALCAGDIAEIRLLVRI
jgi:hypothetical protein